MIARGRTWLLAMLAAVAMASAGASGRAHAGVLDGIAAALSAIGWRDEAPASPVTALTAHMARLPAPADGHVVLGAHAGMGSHWTFVNRRGETFTVGTPDEMKRVVEALEPQAAGRKIALTIHLTTATAVEAADMLGELPAGASLMMIAGDASYPLVRVAPSAAGPSGRRFRLAVRAGLHLDLGTQAEIDEALRQLARPMQRQRVRVLSLEPGGPPTLSSRPRADATVGPVPAEPIDPFKLVSALPSLSGQTAVVSARPSGKLLVFKPGSGSELTLIHSDLTAAAASAGVDLLIVQSATAYQPGSRNWLWQRFDIEGLDRALAHATLADALATLTAGREPAVARLSRQSADRVTLSVAPPAAGSDGLGGMWREMTSTLTGNVAATAVEAQLTSSDRRRELSLRLLPMIPSTWQAVYLACAALGLLGLSTAWTWWQRIWPAEERAEYPSAAGFRAAQAARILAGALLFLPVAGPAALVVTVAGFLWRLLRQPLSLMRHRSESRPEAG